jgi:cation:H+ antiporter
VIGLTVVAVGTSLPEMATSVAAAWKGETDIAVGNVIGSNVFNLAGVLGASAAVRPISPDPRVLTADLPAVALISLLIVPLTFRGRTMGRRAGLILLGTYAILGIWLFRG